MQPPPLLGINGRLRQHITKVGAAYANRISSPNSRNALADDDFVKRLLESGKITEKKLQQAIDGYNHFGSTFAWMQDVKDSILDRADNVFLAKYGRDPTEDSDFAVNSDYYRICNNLERNWHHYNADLEKLRWDYKGKLVPRTDTEEQAPTVEKSNLKKNPGSRFGLSLFTLAGFIAFVVAVKTIPSKNLVIFCSLLGAWLASAFIYMAMFPLWRCVRCGKGYYKEIPLHCKRCGVKL